MMKFIFLPFVLLISLSCGKQKSVLLDQTVEQEKGCNLNGTLVPCESIRGADGEGIDLLEAMIEVPIKIENTDIIFLKDKKATSTGRRINCEVAVSEGEVYRFALRGKKLFLMTKEGNFEMEKLTQGNDLWGTWMWKGYVDEGTFLIRNLTLMEGEKAILRSSCEL